MKFRTDFVTNSSSSSFIAFHVNNPELFNHLQSLGIKFKNTEHGEFTDGMEVVLPSGEKLECWMTENAEDFPSCSEVSMPVWVVLMLLQEIGDYYPMPNIEDYTEFTVELIKMLNNAGILNLDLDDSENWEHDVIMLQLQQSLGHFSQHTKSADIELDSGFEGEIIFLEYYVARNGYELCISMNDDVETEENNYPIEGLRVAITGKTEYFDNREELAEYIESLGGLVVSGVTGNTDLLICNDLSDNSSKMQKADQFCVPVISEEGFIRRYGETSEFDLDDEDESIYEELFECTYEGEFNAAFHRYGVGKVLRSKPGRKKK